MEQSNIDIIKQSLDLSQTIQEGLDHIGNKIQQGELEETFYLLEDSINGYASIQKAVQPILADVDPDGLKMSSVKLKEAFDMMVTTCEYKKINDASEIIQNSLIPAYKTWQKDLSLSLRPYILS